jgi:D-beta-D-heptose 7-phosphate kinase/D-beta-D-heptose 1-phosphate adenosyltransferase
LNESAALGHRLFVAINSDSSVRRLKGPGRPLIHDRDRAVMVAALAVVAHVLVFDDPTPQKLIEAIRPNVLVKGGSYTQDEVVGADFVRSYGGEVHLATMVEGISTTQILAAMRQEHEPIAAPIIHALPRADGSSDAPQGGAKRVA